MVRFSGRFIYVSRNVNTKVTSFNEKYGKCGITIVAHPMLLRLKTCLVGLFSGFVWYDEMFGLYQNISVTTPTLLSLRGE